MPLIGSFVPHMIARQRIAVLLCARSSLALALLFRGVFERANRLMSRHAYELSFVRASGSARLAIADASVATRSPRGRYHYLVVTPFDGFGRDEQPNPADVRLLRREHAKGTVIASACLGALPIACAGLLDGREATTHWGWSEVVRERYPAVKWAMHRMICDQGDVITAGGYLGVVDLALHIVGVTSGLALAHRLGGLLLADSIRQRQSVFAQRLIVPSVEEGALAGLSQWIDAHLGEAISARDMARRCHLSLRTFHRRFVATHRVTPRKFLQLKRVERVQQQVRDGHKSMKRILDDIGVSDASSFRRVFRRELGLSPAEYWRRLRIEREGGLGRPSRRGTPAG